MEGHLHDLNSQKLGEYVPRQINLCTNNTSAGYSAKKKKKTKAIILVY